MVYCVCISSQLDSLLLTKDKFTSNHLILIAIFKITNNINGFTKVISCK